jgi:uncharacterized protein YaeQ
MTKSCYHTVVQDRLGVSEVPMQASRALSHLAQRSMRLHVTIQEGHVS